MHMSIVHFEQCFFCRKLLLLVFFLCYRFQLNRVNKQQFETKHFTAIRSFDKFGWLREVSDRKKTNRTLSKRTYQSHLNIKSRNYLFPNHEMLEFMMTDNWTGLNKSIQLITISNHVTMFYYAGFHRFFLFSLVVIKCKQNHSILYISRIYKFTS